MSIVTRNIFYGVFMFLFAILTFIFNGFLLTCFWRFKNKNYLTVSLIVIFNTLLEIVSSFLIMIIQPRFLPTEHIYFFIPQGLIQYMNLKIWALILYDLYMAIVLGRIFFAIVLLMVNFMRVKTSTFSVVSGVVFGVGINMVILMVLFVSLGLKS